MPGQRFNFAKMMLVTGILGLCALATVVALPLPKTATPDQAQQELQFIQSEKVLMPILQGGIVQLNLNQLEDEKLPKILRPNVISRVKRWGPWASKYWPMGYGLGK